LVGAVDDTLARKSGRHQQMTISEYKDSRRTKLRSVMVLDRIK
jgi:hypothetical protein